MAAYKQAKASGDGASAEGVMDAALKGATSVPMETAQRAREVADIVASLKPITNPNMASDLTVADALARAALVGALANVEINLGSLKDANFAEDVRSKVSELQR
jgi:glutamate formiminotransferase/formiminotetrahydrofolate cyclodeaminase